SATLVLPARSLITDVSGRWLLVSCSPASFFFLCCFRHPRALHSFPTRRSSDLRRHLSREDGEGSPVAQLEVLRCAQDDVSISSRSEEHTSELQSRGHLVCRLLLEKKKHPRCAKHRRYPPDTPSSVPRSDGAEPT